MADVSQLEVNGTTYNICDATARDSLSHVLELVYPIGSVYINASDSTNPATLLGFGTWERVGTGRVMIDANSTYAAGSTGGSATHTHTTGDCTLTAAQSGVPAHSHGNTIAAKTPSLSHSITQPTFNTPELSHTVTQPVLNNGGAHTHSIVDSSGNNSNLHPANYSYSSSDGHMSDWGSRYKSSEIWKTDSQGSHAHTLKTNVAVAKHAATACTRSTNVAITAHAAADCTMSGSVSNNTAVAAASAHNHGNTGSGSTIQPWVGVYMWKRTA